MSLVRFTAEVTTTPGGAATATVNGSEYSGKLVQIRYVPDGSSPLATGSDITLVGDNTGFPYFTEADIGTSAFNRAPKQPTHAIVDGSAISGGTADVYIDEPMTLTIAQGGDTLSGTFHFWVDVDDN